MDSPHPHTLPLMAWQFALGAQLRQQENVGQHLLDKLGNPWSALLMAPPSTTEAVPPLARLALRDLREGTLLLALEAFCWHAIFPSLRVVLRLQRPAVLRGFRLRTTGRHEMHSTHSWLHWMQWCLLRDLLTSVWGGAAQVAITAWRSRHHSHWRLTLPAHSLQAMSLERFGKWVAALGGRFSLLLARGQWTLRSQIPHGQLGTWPGPDDIALRPLCTLCSQGLHPAQP